MLPTSKIKMYECFSIEALREKNQTQASCIRYAGKLQIFQNLALSLVYREAHS